MIVQCPQCGETHNPKEVEFVNIEEGPRGEDILTYICPVTGKPASATVRGS